MIKKLVLITVYILFSIVSYFLIDKFDILKFNSSLLLIFLLIMFVAFFFPFTKKDQTHIFLKGFLFTTLYFNTFLILNYVYLDFVSKSINSSNFTTIAITIYILLLVLFISTSIPFFLSFIKVKGYIVYSGLLFINLILVFLELKLISFKVLIYYQYYLITITFFVILILIKYLLFFKLEQVFSIAGIGISVLLLSFFISLQDLSDIVIKKDDSIQNNKNNKNSFILIKTKFTDIISKFSHKFKKIEKNINKFKPHIFLITIDTVTPYNLDLYGYNRITMPNLTKLSNDFIVFKKAFAQGDNTLPSLSSLMTSKYVTEIYWSNKKKFLPLKKENLTFAEILKETGYNTYGIVTHSYFLPKLGFEQGFDNWDIDMVSTKDEIAFNQETSSIIYEKAKYILSNYKDKKPIFMWTHFFDPHDSYVLRTDASKFGFEQIDLYDNELNHTDIYLGKFIQSLKDLGIYDNSIIIICSDHGEGFNLHGYNLHGQSLYNDQIWVPLLIKFPDVKSQSVDTEVALIDIIPTIVDYLNIDKNYAFSGDSLLNIINSSSKTKPIYSLHYTTYKEFYSMIYNGYKLIYYPKQDLKQLYDIRVDMNEKNDLSEQNPEITYGLWKTMSEWIKKQKAIAKEINGY